MAEAAPAASAVGWDWSCGCGCSSWGAPLADMFFKNLIRRLITLGEFFWRWAPLRWGACRKMAGAKPKTN